MKNIYVAISGRSLSGKDTAISYIAEKLAADRIPTYTMAFADPVKEILRTAFHLTTWHTDTQEGKASRPRHCYGFSVRELLQQVGTDMFRRHISDTVWADNLVIRSMAHADRVQDLRFKKRVYLISDMREEVEFNALNAHDLFSIYLTRHVDGSASNGHTSEMMFSAPFSEVIDNQDCSAEAFTGLIDEMYPRLLAWVNSKYESED